MEIAINQLLSCDGPPERSKETAGGCARSPAQPSPAQPSPPLADAKHKHLLASSGEGKGKRQEPQDYGKILSGRWLTNAAGMAGRGAGVEGMGCATAGPALIGLCRTQETTSGAVPAQQYAECSEEHTVKSISIHSIFTSQRTSQLPAVTHISCQGNAGSRALACALCIATAHAARAKDASAISLQPLGRTSAPQITGLNNS